MNREGYMKTTLEFIKLTLVTVGGTLAIMFALGIASLPAHAYDTYMKHNSTDVSNKKVYLKLLNDENKKKQWQLVSADEGHPVRDGKKSWRFELQEGWCGADSNHSDCEKDRYRSEVSTKNHTKISKKPFWMSVSIYIPQDYKINPNVSVSWWQIYQTGKTPVIMLRERNGLIRLDMMPSGMTEKTFLLADVDQMRGKWTDFKFNIRLDHTEGFVKAWMKNDSVDVYDEWLDAGTISKLKSKKMVYRMDTGIYHTYVSRNSGEYHTQVIYVDAFRHSNKEKNVGPQD
jgi:hypothetical protein